MTYNLRRNLLAAISLKGKLLYHLFHLGNSSHKKSPLVQLLRKSKWNPNHSTDWSKFFHFYLERVSLITDNWITSLDFDPSGERIASVDQHGLGLISDTNTNDSIYAHKFVYVTGRLI